jgi:sterol 14-demethylase
MRDPLALIQRGLREQGRIFSLRLGNKPAVVLLGPEYNRFFFEETDKLLSMREAYPFFRQMFHKQLYFYADLEEYREQRGIIWPRFQGKMMADHVDVMVKETHAFMDRLGDEGELDLAHALAPLVVNVAAGALVGTDFQRELGLEFHREFPRFAAGVEFVLPPWLPLPRLLRSRLAKRRLHAMLADQVRERRRTPRVPADFMQTLVEARYSDGRPVPDIIVINLILALIWAGYETTTAQASWALIDVLRHRQCLERLLEEEREVLTDGEALSLDALSRLKYLDWTLRESGRMTPTGALVLRVASSDFELAGYRIQKGSLVVAAPSISHRLEDVFAAPNTFDPERFSPARAEDRTPYGLINFGGGLHRCVGMHFATLEIKVITTLLLRHFHLELIDQHPTMVRGANIKWPASPCRVRYRRRLSREVQP